MLKHLLAAAGIFAAGAFAAQAADLSGKSWEAITAQAKQEGKLTWYVWYLQDDLRRFVAPFEKEYGIKVTIPEGTQSATISKILAERGRETGDIDVFSVSYGSYESVDGNALLMSLKVLPEDAGRIFSVTGVDGTDKFVAFWGNQTGIAYDPAHVDATKLPQTPDEFAAFWRANPGKFGFNYEGGGAGPSFYQSILRKMTGLDDKDGKVTDEKLKALDKGYAFFREYAKDYVITASNADNVTRLSDGELWMATAWEDHLAGLQTRGEARKSLKFYVPSMGMYGGGNGVGIPKNAKNAAAAAVFINWLTSPAVQDRFNVAFGTAPMNTAANGDHALVSKEQRAYQTGRARKPLLDKIDQGFVDKVILER
jgi:putative spermidine/putrescine transport system substrate-binding protein